jgi:beta-N-acetylhexosaminidase
MALGETPALPGKSTPFQESYRMKVRIFLLLLAIFLSSSISATEKTSGPTWTELTLKRLTLREKIAQLIQIRVPGKFLSRQSSEFQGLQDQVRLNKVGGVVLFAGNIYESAILLNELQTISKLPLLVSADFERGLSFRIEDATPFPWTMALGAAGSEQFAYQQGIITAQESRALGVHWIFAPVVDVNNNPDNPVINIRSFGEDPALVSRLGAAFIRGAKEGGVLTTAKHFPGHGDTTTDSHIGLPIVPSDMHRLEAIEFVPFKSAIEAGVDSVMTAHIAVPQITDSPDLPATLSSRILTDILRNSLHFNGLIVTDALEMGAITNRYWCGLAAVRAVQAGADILLLPANVKVAIDEVERAVLRGDISESRIDESVRRILNAKSRLGLNDNRTVSIKNIGNTVASPAGLRLAQNIANKSITSVKDDQHLLPVSSLADRRIFSLTLTADLESSPGSIFQAEMRRRFPSVSTAWGNQTTSVELLADIEKLIGESDLIICSTFTRLSTGMPASQQSIIKKLIASQKPVVWVSFGSPYVLRIAPEIGTYLCTFSLSDVSQIAAVKALTGEIAISGKMPVSIPGYVKAGEGLQIPKLDMTLQSAASEPGALEKIGPMLNSFISEGIFTEAEIIIGSRNTIELNYRTSKNPIEDSSFTKHVATISLAMMGIDSGILIPEAPVQDYLPEMLILGNEKIRIEDLLMDISGSLKTVDGKSESTARIVDRIVSRASGIPVERFLASQPVMKNLKSAEELAVFAQMLLNRGTYNHRRYFSAKTIAYYTGASGLWTKSSDSETTKGILSPSAYGYSSPSGSLLWSDPDQQIFISLLVKSPPILKTDEIVRTQRMIIESVMQSIHTKQK